MKIIIDGKAAEVSVSGGGLPEGTVAIKPLTKAEYNALTNEEKQADVAYAITDDAGSSSGGSSEEIYSTEETRIGTWIDGKPLYRRVFEVTTPSGTSWGQVVPPISNAYVVRLEAYLLPSKNSGSDPTVSNVLIPFPYPGDSVLLMRYSAVSSETPRGVAFMVASNRTNKPALVILEYTKTTDTGGAR